ncbi:transcription factor bHLH128 isoform X2 [Aristolochia californica]|uniref:transcription factor bHLH128 isoform X2 n=1 Tax=Aristolochia californica TaxID=171875 RepID=UPI0035DFD949
MYSSQRPVGPGLTRYGSAPSSLLKSLADSVVADDEFSAVGSDNLMSKYFSGDSSCLTSESSCKATNISAALDNDVTRTAFGLERSSSYGLQEMAVGDLVAADDMKTGTSPSPSLIRHSSSPAGFLSHLMVDGSGFSVTRGLGNYGSQAGCNGSLGMGNGRLKSQLSFSARQDSLSALSEISVPEVGESTFGHNGSDDGPGHSYMSGNFRMGSWEETNSIVFSAPPNKRTKDIHGDLAAALNSLDSQFNVSNASLDKLQQIQQDSVPCRIRAKRGCATHPRSIAERDRRTRISEKLKKLQDLVPNMDKQTNTAEMLDLAVHHIKSLQNQVQKLQQERSNCTCASRTAT